MNKIINKIAIVLLLAFGAACVDESLDPVKFKEVKKATLLTLRGDSFDNLNNTGCVSSFFKNNLVDGEKFSVDADFFAEDQESLQEVQLYASILTTTSKGLAARPRKLVATFPGSVFTFPADSKIKRGNISATRASIIAALNIVPDSVAKKLGTNDITMDMDLVLTDGSKVLASNIVNPNLFQSVIFFPAMVLAYCANDQEDFKPLATPSLLGTWGLSTDKKKVSRTKIPSLKSGAKDTLYITFDNDIITAPTVTFSPDLAATGATATTLVRSKKVNANGFYTADDSKNGFYLIYTAGPTYTGAVTATISGATANVAGVILTQKTETQTINVDNIAPTLLSTSTGTRIGEGQFVTMKVTFNEKLSTKSANAIKVTIDGSERGLETVKDEKMKVAADGLSATLLYVFKRAVPTVAANHGAMPVVFSNAIDEAGNTTIIPAGNLTVDVGVPPAPTLALLATYDLGTQINWTAAQTTGGSNAAGSTSGKVYFIAVETGDPAPTKFSVDLDGVATWLGSEDDPDSKTTPKAKLPIDGEQQGIVEVEDGDSGTVFTPFTANGDFDIYAVFVSSTGTISAITATPQLTGVVMQ